MYVSKYLNSNPTVIDKVFAKGTQSQKLQGFFTKMEHNEDLFQNLVLLSVPAQQWWEALMYGYSAFKDDSLSKKQKSHNAALWFTDAVFTSLILIPLGLGLNKNSKKWAEKLLQNVKHDKNRFNIAKLGFRTFLTVFLMGVLAKRILVPIFQTPTAKMLNDIIHNKKKKDDDDHDDDD